MFMLSGPLGAVSKEICQQENELQYLFKEKNGIFNATHPLKNIEMQKYYQDEPRFNGIFSRNNLPKKAEDGACVINLDEYADV